MEELVAELNAAFLSAVLGRTPSFREEHAAYIAGCTGSVPPATTSTEKKTGRCHPPAAILSAVQKQRKGPRHAGCRRARRCVY